MAKRVSEYEEERKIYADEVFEIPQQQRAVLLIYDTSIGKFRPLRDTDLLGGGGGVVDTYKVKVSDNDAVPNFLIEKIVNGGAINIQELNDGNDEDLQLSVKVDNMTIEIDPTNDYLRVKDGGITESKIADAAITTSKIRDGAITTSKLADASVTDEKIVSVSWSKVDKTGSKLEDIEDVPPYSGNALRVLRVKADESGVEWAQVEIGDEKVKTDINDPTPGYLIDKIDNQTLEVDTNNHIMRVKDGGITTSKINIDNNLSFNGYRITNLGSPVDSSDAATKGYVDNLIASKDEFTELNDTPSSYTGYASKFVKVKSTEDGLEFADVTWDDVQNKPTEYPPEPHTHTKSDITDFNESDYVHTFGDETIGGNKTFTGNVVIQGDLTVQGTTTTVESETLSVKDNIITLNEGESGSGVSLGTSGIEIDRGTEQNAYWIFDETSDTFYAKLEDGTKLRIKSADPTESDDVVTLNYLQSNYYDKSTIDGWNLIKNYTLTQDLNANNYRITGLPTPTNPTDAATKSYVDTQIGLKDEFIELNDTPPTYEGYGGKYLKVKDDETGIEFVDLPPTGATTFLELNDTPNSYSGYSLYFVRVNSSENGLEFYDIKSRGYFVVPDDGSILDALNWASTFSGGTIIIKPGTYSVPTFTEIPSYTRIVGIGDVTITYADTNSDRLFYINSKNDVTIENIKIDTSSASSEIIPIYISTSSNIVIRNCTLISNSKVIKASGNNIYIIGNITKTTRIDRINIEASGTNFVIQNNTVYNGFFGIGTSSGNLTDSVIEGNVIISEDYENNVVVQDAIYIGGNADGTRIANNTIKSRDIGIRVSGTEIMISSNVLHRNPISGIGYNGILLVDTTNSVVNGNIIIGYSSHSIYELNSAATSDYNVIVNNRCSHQITTVGPNTLVANNLVG